MNYEIVTLEDCLIAYSLLGQLSIIKNGQVIGFEDSKGNRLNGNREFPLSPKIKKLLSA